MIKGLIIGVSVIVILVVAYYSLIVIPLQQFDEPAEYTPQQRYDDLVKERDLAIIESQISQNLTPQQRDKIMQNYYRINAEMRALQLEYDIEE